MYDAHNLVAAIAAEGAAYGFANTTAACQPHMPLTNIPGDPGNTILSTCPNPDQHLFWDYNHFSTAFHVILARELQHSLALNSNLFD